MSLLVIMHQDVDVNGSMYYDSHMYILHRDVYKALRKSNCFQRCLAKCVSPTGVVYWRSICDIKRGLPGRMPVGHHVRNRWFDLRIHGANVEPGGIIQAQGTTRQHSVSVQLRRKPCGCGGGTKKPEINDAKLRNGAVHSTNRRMLDPQQAV